MKIKKEYLHEKKAMIFLKPLRIQDGVIDEL